MATPTWVRHVKYSNSNETSGASPTFKLRVPASGSNNFQGLILYTPSGATLSSIKSYDNSGTLKDTWSTTAKATITDSANGIKLGLFGFGGCSAGVVEIRVIYTAALAGFSAWYGEAYNVDTTTPFDVTPVSAQPQSINSGGSVQSGSITPVTNGCMIVQVAHCDDFGPTGFCGIQDGFSLLTGDTGFSLLDADIVQGFACQYEIQTTAAAINPAVKATCTSVGNFWTSITFALRPASAGTAPPTGPYVFGIYHCLYTNATKTGLKIQFPTFGSAYCLTCTQAYNSGTLSIDSVSGASSGSWTRDANVALNTAQAYWNASNAPSATEMLTLGTHSGGAALQGILYDMKNTGTRNTSAGLVGTTAFGPGTSTPALVVSPSVSSGVTIAALGLFTGPPDSLVSPSDPANFLSTWYTGETDLSGMDSGDCHGMYEFSSNSSQSWTWDDTAHTTGTQGIAVVFQSNAAAAAPHFLACLGAGA